MSAYLYGSLEAAMELGSGLISVKCRVDIIDLPFTARSSIVERTDRIRISQIVVPS
jgi:hypothetical protein